MPSRIGIRGGEFSLLAMERVLRKSGAERVADDSRKRTKQDFRRPKL